VLSYDAVGRLLRAREGRDFAARRDAALIRFLVDTGCRRSELESMTVEGTDTRAGTAVVTDGKVKLSATAARLSGSSICSMS
jgi:integrase